MSNLSDFFPSGGGGATEGTNVLSTSETAGKVLTSDGDNTSSWQTPASGPAQSAVVFSASNNASESITANTLQVITLGNVIKDDNSEWNTSTHRYTATTAGWYLFTLNVSITRTSGTASFYTGLLRKNGSTFGSARDSNTNDIYFSALCISGVTYLNGTTDYVESAIYFGGGSSPVFTMNGGTNLSSHLIEAT